MSLNLTVRLHVHQLRGYFNKFTLFASESTSLPHAAFELLLMMSISGNNLQHLHGKTYIVGIRKSVAETNKLFIESTIK